MTQQFQQKTTCGFTLIETLVSITLLVVAVAAPMTLATQSLSTAFYARDQVTAFHLAQEAMEGIRTIRDQNIIKNVYGTQTDLFDKIPLGTEFIIDTLAVYEPDAGIEICSGVCQPLRSNGSLYGYLTQQGWEDTRFTRTVVVEPVGSSSEELRVLVEVRWRTGLFQERSFIISENLYRWIDVS